MTAPHVVFRQHGALYAVAASAVRELFQLPELAPAPEAPGWIAGVLNLRGQVIPVIDAAMRLGLEPRSRRISDAVIVLERDGAIAGVVVDEVLDVREISDEATDSPALASGGRRSRLTRGVARAQDDLITLLDEAELLRLADAQDVAAAAGETQPRAGWSPDSEHPLDSAVFRERALALVQAAAQSEPSHVAPVAVIALNGEWFGVDLECVREFADLRGVTPVPCCPEHVAGAVNLRGEILTLVDVRKALTMSAPTSLAGAKMMVVQLGEVRAGVVVDQVLDVVNLGTADLSPVPYSVRSTLEEHIAGMAAYRDRMLAILDLPGIFNREDWVVDAEP